MSNEEGGVRSLLGRIGRSSRVSLRGAHCSVNSLADLLPCYDQLSSSTLMTELAGNTFIDGPAGRIEAIIKDPAARVSRAAIVCHPHPLFGGTMHNKVVFRIARAFQNAGFAVLRFNFRGTGKSEGQHDNGLGEQDDLRAVIEFAQRRYPEAEIWLAGFSFGSAVLLRAAACDERVRAFIAAGVPLSKYDFSGLLKCNKPKLFVHGSQDEYGAASDLEKLFATLDEPKELRIIDGADHFFEGALTELSDAVSRFIVSVDAGQHHQLKPPAD